jgi:uncharacterized protein
MASEPRVVFDANVLVSALLVAQSVPRQAFDRASSAGRILISAATLLELHSVLARPKFDRYITAEYRKEFLSALVRDSVLVEITEQISQCRDPNDNKYLELAVSGSATHLVTGDNDLLSMNLFRGIRVVEPRTFLIEFPEAQP